VPEKPVALDRAKLDAARLVAVDKQPFLAAALYSLRPYSAPGLGTIGVDEKWRLYVDPDILRKWSVNQVAGVLLHEVGHVVRDHAGRAKSVLVSEDTKFQWNISGDAEINDDLIADGVTLPLNPVLPRTLGLPDGKAAEFYYSHLRQGHKLPQIKGCGPGATGIDADEAELERLFIPHNDGINLDEHGGLDSATADLVRAQVAEAVLAQVAIGSAPGNWSRWAESFRRPVIDWRKQLNSVVRSRLHSPGRADYTYSRLSRRRVAGVVLPGMHQPTPCVALILDTS
jgi:hypothetical protein